MALVHSAFQAGSGGIRAGDCAGKAVDFGKELACLNPLARLDKNPCEASVDAGGEAMLSLCRNLHNTLDHGPARQPLVRKIAGGSRRSGCGRSLCLVMEHRGEELLPHHDDLVPWKETILDLDGETIQQTGGDPTAVEPPRRDGRGQTAHQRLG